MVDRAHTLNMALNMTRMAIELLDSIGEGRPALHLQHAADLMVGESAPKAPEALDEPAAAGSPFDALRWSDQL